MYPPATVGDPEEVFRGFEKNLGDLVDNSPLGNSLYNFYFLKVFCPSKTVHDRPHLRFCWVVWFNFSFSTKGFLRTGPGHKCLPFQVSGRVVVCFEWMVSLS